MLHRLCIVGMGLMGGAVGMAARRVGVASRVIGVADQKETIEEAKRLGVADEVTLDLQEGVQDADLVVLAVPLKLIPEVAQALIPSCREGTVITDIGSSKRTVVLAVQELIAKLKAPVSFVGSHPITGSEKTGIQAAGEVLLAGAPCVLTPTPATDHEAYLKVEAFWKALEMKTLRLSPEDHDTVLARSSHLPHLAAAALINCQSNRSMELSGSGLRDMSRLAGSDIAQWTDIITQNAREQVKALKNFRKEIDLLIEETEALALSGTPGAEAARERLFRYLADARQRREKRFPPAKPVAASKPAPAAAAGPVSGFRTQDTQIMPPARE